MDKEIWEQLEGESNASYTRFLIYKNLGMARSLEKAYSFYLINNQKATKGNKRQQLLEVLLEQERPVPGSWTNESSAYCWKKRAEAFDISELRKTEKQTFSKQVGILKSLTEKLEESLKDPTLKPKNFFQIIQALDVINRRYTPELARAVFLGDEAEQQQESTREENQERREPTKAD